MHRLSQCIARGRDPKILSKSFRTSSQLPAGPKRRFGSYFQSLKQEEPPKIRYFERFHNGSGSSKTREIGDDEMEEDEEAAVLKEKIAELEEELSILRGDSGSTIGPLLAQLSPEDRAKVEKALKDNAEMLREVTEEDSDYGDMDFELEDLEQGRILSSRRLSNIQSLDLALRLQPESHQVGYVKSFNKSLMDAATNLSEPSARKNLWRSYVRCKQNLPNFLCAISEKAWNILWESQHRRAKIGIESAAHLRLLLEDMRQSGKELTASQRLSLIEHLHQEGRFEDALRVWSTEEESLRGSSNLRLDFLTLGIKIHASLGDPSAAEKLALQSLSQYGDTEPRILIPVIEAWLQQGSQDNVKHAWALYLRLRAVLDSSMTLSDYDEVFMFFLRAKQQNLGLAIFRDMMLTGQKSGFDSTELYKTSLGLVGHLQSQSINVNELNKISLTGLTLLPKQFQNKFFFGSWIKKLIGMGEVNAAASIVELMYARGVKPDPKHLNGIIGAWLRKGSSHDTQKAIQMAWAMIYERQDLVARREGRLTRERSANHSVPMESSINVPIHLQRTVPPATIETLSLLLLHYQRRGFTNHIEQLQSALSIAKLIPNSYYMNHLLYAELRRGNPHQSWKLYLEMSPTVQTDLETWACLWDCMKAHLNRSARHPSDDFPSNRQLFASMALWIGSLSEKERSSVRERFSRDMYDQIVLCTCLSQDIEGLIATLYGLRMFFSTYPNEDTIRSIALQVARLGPIAGKIGKGRRKPRQVPRSRDQASIMNVSKVMEILSSERGEELSQCGVQMDELSEDVQAEERLYILSRLLRAVWERTNVGAETGIDQLVDKVAADMGVERVKLLDPLLSDTSEPSLKGKRTEAS
ncbi:hypothetical protein MMC09_004103 [Bachmanniomyces sp. S44760]|nr:hypothetical protein [Bachmanniomyces sp. S44760]